jgi:hypothetical protein
MKWNLNDHYRQQYKREELVGLAELDAKKASGNKKKGGMAEAMSGTEAIRGWVRYSIANTILARTHHGRRRSSQTARDHH